MSDDINTRLSQLEGRYEADSEWFKAKHEQHDQKLDTILGAVQGLKETQSQTAGRDKVLVWGGSGIMALAATWLGQHFGIK